MCWLDDDAEEEENKAEAAEQDDKNPEVRLDFAFWMALVLTFLCLSLSFLFQIIAFVGLENSSLPNLTFVSVCVYLL